MRFCREYVTSGVVCGHVSTNYPRGLFRCHNSTYVDKLPQRSIGGPPEVFFTDGDKPPQRSIKGRGRSKVEGILILLVHRRGNSVFTTHLDDGAREEVDLGLPAGDRVLAHGRIAVGLEGLFQLYGGVDVILGEGDTLHSCEAADFPHRFFHFVADRAG